MLFGKKKLLIIDDTEMMRMLFYAQFEEEMNVHTAIDGASGIAAASKEKPDVIILDINMPDMSGVEVLKRLNSDPTTRDIPVVIITGDGFTPDVQKQVSKFKSCKGFLNKLASAEDITKTVKKAML